MAKDLYSGLNGDFSYRLHQLISAVAAQGGSLGLSSGYRTNQEQQQLYNQAVAQHGAANATQWAAKPGTSNHERGLAADLSGVSSFDLAHRLAPQFGLVFPLSNEPWHVEPSGIKTQSYGQGAPLPNVADQPMPTETPESRVAAVISVLSGKADTSTAQADTSTAQADTSTAASQAGGQIGSQQSFLDKTQKQGDLSFTRPVTYASAPPPAPQHTGGGGAVAAVGGSVGGSAGANKVLGQQMAAGYGWHQGDAWTALNNVVMSESGWNANAANPTSSARGIAQNIKGWSADYQPGNANQQISWLLNYIASRYGSPQAAWAHEQRYNWY